MATPRLPDDFKEFLKLLDANKVEYLLIGGYAVGYYGYPRATADMDIWIGIRPDNARKLVATLREFGFGDAGLSDELLLEEGKILRMGMPPLRLEIHTSISGVNFEECYRERVQGTIDGVQVNLISLPHLKANKAAAGRHRDLDDLEHLQ